MRTPTAATVQRAKDQLFLLDLYHGPIGVRRGSYSRAYDLMGELRRPRHRAGQRVAR